MSLRNMTIRVFLMCVASLALTAVAYDLSRAWRCYQYGEMCKKTSKIWLKLQYSQELPGAK